MRKKAELSETEIFDYLDSSDEIVALYEKYEALMVDLLNDVPEAKTFASGWVERRIAEERGETGDYEPLVEE